VHFRTFATSDNALVVGDTIVEADHSEIFEANSWFESMAKAYFRRVDNGVSVNVFLPDRIFDHSGSAEKLVPFTYDERNNILSRSMDFVRLIAVITEGVCSFLGADPPPSFSFSKR